MSGSLLTDASWVRQSFLVTAENLELVDVQNRTFTRASLKFTDTTPGGNFAINPPPQFTRFCDIKARGTYAGNQTGGLGMGRYYSEAIDDNAQLIHMRFGTPKFNSLTTFFTGFYNTGAGQLARTGRGSSVFYYLGRAAGFVVSILNLKLLAIQLLGVGVRFFANMPSSKFYYLKPAMPLYWNAVTTMVNQIAVNRGIVPRIGSPENNEKLGQNYEFNQEGLTRLHNLLPDIFKEGGGIDVYALANRAQRLARQREKRIEQALGNNTTTDIRAAIQIIEQEVLKDTKPNFNDETTPGKNTSYMSKWFSSLASKVKTAPTPEKGANGTTPADSATDYASDEETADKAFWDFAKAEFDNGSDFATFRVNNTGHVSESFSNSVTDSEIANKINSMSSQSRMTNFNFANGNLADFGIATDLIGGAINAVKDTVSGVAAGVGLSGLAALGGAAFADIPKHWQSSIASLPRSNYTINLVSPYGNPISQLINLYIPLAMLLASALPLSTGKHSYTSPFLVELYDKGRSQTRLGMVDSLSITRGTGNLGFNSEGHPLGIDVSFSIIDMSSILHMPISEGFQVNPALVAAGAVVGGAVGGFGGGLAQQGAATGTTGVLNGIGSGATNGAITGAKVAGGISGAIPALLGAFDSHSSFSDYMAVLAGMSLSNQIYSFRKLKLNLTLQMTEWESWKSPSHFASVVGDLLPSRLVGTIFRGTAR